MTPEQIAAAFPGSTLGPAEPVPAVVCGYCGRPIRRTVSGALELAAPCRQAGRHITEADNALRIEFGLTWGAYWARVERYGTPATNRAAWTQPRTKANKWQANPRGVQGGVHTPTPMVEP